MYGKFQIYLYNSKRIDRKNWERYLKKTARIIPIPNTLFFIINVKHIWSVHNFKTVKNSLGYFYIFTFWTSLKISPNCAIFIKKKYLWNFISDPYAMFFFTNCKKCWHDFLFSHRETLIKLWKIIGFIR